MATVSLYLDKRYEKKNGTYPLKMIVYSDGKNVPYSFGNKISLTEIRFEKLCSKKLKDEELLEIRKYTDIEIGRAQEIIKSIGNDFSFELFESFYLDNKKIKKGRKDGNTNENDPLWPIQIDPLNLLPKKVKVASKNIPVFT